MSSYSAGCAYWNSIWGRWTPKTSRDCCVLCTVRLGYARCSRATAPPGRRRPVPRFYTIRPRIPPNDTDNPSRRPPAHNGARLPLRLSPRPPAPEGPRRLAVGASPRERKGERRKEHKHPYKPRRGDADLPHPSSTLPLPLLGFSARHSPPTTRRWGGQKRALMFLHEFGMVISGSFCCAVNGEEEVAMARLRQCTRDNMPGAILPAACVPAAALPSPSGATVPPV